jgi:hypothetical protein
VQECQPCPDTSLLKIIILIFLVLIVAALFVKFAGGGIAFASVSIAFNLIQVLPSIAN